ncbi:MAG TPA: hypothetical protein VNK41_06740 [Vicinamibacterales bacterium]|nr:hypothetical protein [Vicinamibacterales bacterium]
MGIFPSPKSTLRLVGAILPQQDDEWAVAHRRYFSAESMKQFAAPALSPSAQELLAVLPSTPAAGCAGVSRRKTVDSEDAERAALSCM